MFNEKLALLNDFYEYTMANGFREAGIGDNDAVKGRFLCSHSSESDFYCHFFLHGLSRYKYISPGVCPRCRFQRNLL